jgi:hypothetical protein
MEIVEIWVPELLVVVFLALPLLRPFVKRLWPLEGLTWLPLVALGIAIGIFPAYGFRPECVPMLAFAIIYNIVHFSPIVSGMFARSNDAFRDRGVLFTLFAFILLSAATIPMFAFSSRIDALPAERDAVTVVRVNRDYFLRIYGPVQSNRPLIFLVPPEWGSAASVELVCAELQKKRFTVVTYVSQDKNSQPKLLAYWRIFRNAAVLVSANEKGRAIETERRKEIELLLPRLPALLNTGDDNLPPLLLAGYGAGGSALAYLAGENGFTSSYGNVRGVVAIESRLWSSYLPEARSVPPLPLTPGVRGVFARFWANIVNRFNNLKPQRVSRSGTLPGAGLSQPGLPVLYLVSGRALDVTEGQKPYQAVFDTLRSGSGPAALAAIEGAGPLDYQDYPLTHPIYSFLLPGQKDIRQISEDPIGDTASIIGNFASILWEQAEIGALPRYAISGSLYAESKGLPGFRL